MTSLSVKCKMYLTKNQPTAVVREVLFLISLTPSRSNPAGRNAVKWRNSAESVQGQATGDVQFSLSSCASECAYMSVL